LAKEGTLLEPVGMLMWGEQKILIRFSVLPNKDVLITFREEIKKFLISSKK